jgi:hypothetical protein
MGGMERLKDKEIEFQRLRYKIENPKCCTVGCFCKRKK